MPTAELSDEDRVRACKLLELQRHAMLMYTSCGWFFDEISGIETVQVIQYAGRAIATGADRFRAGTRTGFPGTTGQGPQEQPSSPPGWPSHLR